MVRSCHLVSSLLARLLVVFRPWVQKWLVQELRKLPLDSLWKRCWHDLLFELDCPNSLMLEARKYLLGSPPNRCLDYQWIRERILASVVEVVAASAKLGNYPLAAAVAWMKR